MPLWHEMCPSPTGPCSAPSSTVTTVPHSASRVFALAVCSLEAGTHAELKKKIPETPRGLALTLHSRSPGCAQVRVGGRAARLCSDGPPRPTGPTPTMPPRLPVWRGSPAPTPHLPLSEPHRKCFVWGESKAEKIRASERACVRVQGLCIPGPEQPGARHLSPRLQGDHVPSRPEALLSRAAS